MSVRKLVLSLLCTVLFGCKNTSSRTKVLDGSPRNADFPATIGLITGNIGATLPCKAICTGAFIRHDLVLTAGHCFLNNWYSSAFIFDFAHTGPLPAPPSSAVPTKPPTYDDLVKTQTLVAKAIYIPALFKANHYDQNYNWIDLAIIRFAPNTASGAMIGTLSKDEPKPGDVVSLAGYGETVLDQPASAMIRTVGTNSVVANNTLPTAFGAAAPLSDQRLLRMIRLDGNGSGDHAHASVAPGDSGGALYAADGRIIGTAEVGGSDALPGAAYTSFFINLNQPEVASFIDDALHDRLTAETTDSLKPPLCHEGSGAGLGCLSECGLDLCSHDDAASTPASLCRSTKPHLAPCSP